MTQLPHPHYERHPLSEFFGDMPEDEFEEFLQSVRTHGLTDPRIVVYGGRILDGYHRYRAAVALGLQAQYVPYQGADPAGFVIARNRHRRHLTPSQIAGIVIMCRQWRPLGRPPQQAPMLEGDEKNGSADPFSGDAFASTAEMAEEAGVAEATIKRAKVAEEGGLGDQVRSGELSARAAAQQVRQVEGKPPAPTPMERLRAQNDALALENQELRDQVEGLQLRLQFYEGEQAPVDAKREELFNALRAEITSLKASQYEWQQKADDARREAGYWRKRAAASS